MSSRRTTIVVTTVLAGTMLTGCTTVPDPRTPEIVAEAEDAAVLLWHVRPTVQASGTWLDETHLITTRHGTTHATDPTSSELEIWRAAHGGRRSCAVIAGGTGQPLPIEEETTSPRALLEQGRRDWIVLAMPCDEIAGVRPTARRGSIDVGDEIVTSGWVIDPVAESTASLMPRTRRITSSGRITRLHEGGVFDFEIEHGPEPTDGVSGGPIFVLRGDRLELAGLYLGHWIGTFEAILPWSEHTQMGLAIPWGELPAHGGAEPR